MILHGDCVEVLATLPAESIDACVTDPPYGLEFMGKEWDKLGAVVEDADDTSPIGRQSATPFAGNGQRIRYGSSAASAQVWHGRWASEVFRVLKPGAHLLAFGGTRTYHRMACGIEDAGFEIRDCFAWLYGQGFPKSLNLGEGLGTALKPAHEPIVLARKPFKGSVRSNVEKFGTGALNIDACRIGDPVDTRRPKGSGAGAFPHSDDNWEPHLDIGGQCDLGRWPANVVLDDLAALVLDEQSGESGSGDGIATPSIRNGGNSTNFAMSLGGTTAYADIGGASRFFYVAKPSREERDYGAEGLIERQRDEARKAGHPGGDNPRNRGLQPRGNSHPTVKPVELMRWLVKLITPLNGTVLDPFLGSGTTGMACRYEQRNFIGIEREAEYIAIAERRIAAVAPLFAESTA